MVKWANWFSEYNSYKSVSHLADASKAVADYEHKLKHKHKKISQINIDKVSDSENALCKQTSKWDHMLYSIHDVLNEVVMYFYSYALEFQLIFE